MKIKLGVSLGTFKREDEIDVDEGEAAEIRGMNLDDKPAEGQE